MADATAAEDRARTLGALERLAATARAGGPAQARTLPGRPDIVLPKHGVVIFVHGCFWHRHGCSLSSEPSTRRTFWNDKFARNVARDTRNQRELAAAGWRVLVVWECETRDEPALEARLLTFLTDEVAP